MTEYEIFFVSAAVKFGASGDEKLVFNFTWSSDQLNFVTKNKTEDEVDLNKLKKSGSNTRSYNILPVYFLFCF